MKMGHASYRVEGSSARLCSRVGTGIEYCTVGVQSRRVPRR